MVTQKGPYQDALEKGEFEELDFGKIVSGFQEKDSKPKETIRTADGRTVQKWMPQKTKWRPANS